MDSGETSADEIAEQDRSPSPQQNLEAEPDRANLDACTSQSTDASGKAPCAFDTLQLSHLGSHEGFPGHSEMLSNYTAQNMFDIPVNISHYDSSLLSQPNLRSYNTDDQIMISCEGLQSAPYFDMTDVSLFTAPLLSHQDAVNEPWGFNDLNTTGASSSLANSVPSRTRTPSWSSNPSSGCSSRSSPAPDSTSSSSQSSIPNTSHGGTCAPVRPNLSVAGSQDHFAVQKFHANPRATMHRQDTPHESIEYRHSMTVVSTNSQHVTVEALSSHARDRLMVITQSILHKACDSLSSSGYLCQDAADTKLALGSFVTLPSSQVLQHCLHAYVSRYGLYYGLIPACTLDPTRLVLEASNENVSALLLLLRIAQGAKLVQFPEASSLSTALINACRIVLVDLRKHDSPISTEPEILHSFLVLLQLTTWSGDKSHTSISSKIWESNTKTLKQANLLDHHPLNLEQDGQSYNKEESFRLWQEHEARNRLVYAWVVADLDLSLFHDVAPKIPVNELHANLPEPDVLWQARTAEEWLVANDKLFGLFSTHLSKQPPSLCTAFRKFVNREMLSQEQDYSPAHLRLLLQPLQALASHLYQYLGGIFHGGGTPETSAFMTNLASKASLDEVKTLLQHWYTLCTRSIQRNKGMCPATCQNLITYHLMSLNNLVCFPELERLAQRDQLSDHPSHTSSCLRVRCVEDMAQVLFHCGQALRLLITLASNDRPVWWAAALYRVALVLWNTVSANSGTNMAFTSDSSTAASRGIVALDRVAPEDESLQRFLQHLQGVPVLTKSDGTFVSLDDSGNVLDYVMSVLDQGVVCDGENGIRDALSRLRAR